MSMSLCTIYKTVPVPSYYYIYSLIVIVGVLYVMEIVLMEYIVSQEVNQGIRLIYKEVRKAQKVMRLDQASWHPAHYGAN